ncbi:hypothetical protein T12_5790 [Trichinella patagoniensis]|uniref:Uncharacterized protein n=1 Tax=Trichinella patagoniensis TaxID=990121 RepID=A0A0V1A068_9BILA|nr:hypothetical protein T12_5790 [Trichinella patagoniensis]
MTRCNGASKTRCKASENFFHQRRRYKDKKTALDGSKFHHRVERIKTDDILHMPDKTQTRSYRPSISLTTCRHNAQHTMNNGQRTILNEHKSCMDFDRHTTRHLVQRPGHIIMSGRALAKAEL